MKLDPKQIEDAITQYSSLTRLAITLGHDAFIFLKNLFKSRPSLTEEEQDAILIAVLADASVREELAKRDAGLTSNAD